MKLFMIQLIYVVFSGLLLGLVLTGCLERSQKELLSKVKGLSSPDAIVAAIGEADDVQQQGVFRHWRYSTSDGDLCFSVAGNLALRMMC
jgi:hypothetical protein